MSTSAQSSRSVIKAVYANEVSEGVGARVRRSIGSSELRKLSPFLMLDHATVKKGAGFPDHPHRGQTTVSYQIEGMFQHEDFLGNKGFLNPGDVQWMTAGRGIMHSEMPYFDPDPSKAVNSVGMQLWIDLPSDQKFIEPSYQEKKAEDIPTIHPQDGIEITIISGESHGTKGFVRPVGGCWYFNFRLQKPGASVYQTLPQGWTSFLYIISGKVQVGDDSKIYDKYNTLVLSSQEGQEGVQFTRPEGEEGEETRFILVAGQPLDQPVVQYGPFVVNTQRQAMEAISDFRMGRNGFEKAVGWESEIGKISGP
ncbi:uncharacterized protein IL334_000600 [Kwoniella shivajii]|uniref:Pirin n=1 Tax=Kwoniella shivajii TaxID=564305 RepID=A0ABZ1CQM2_9TREE|nr:hypothetical protein IL334_000600 [Kwoniella shivajii]